MKEKNTVIIGGAYHIFLDQRAISRVLMGRDYVNLHAGKRLEGVLQALSGIIADLQDV